jgi:hypothetical protein
MNQHVADTLRTVTDLRSFKDAVLDMCRPFGVVKSWDFIPNRRKCRLLCFVELESQEQNLALSAELGGYPFGGCVCLEIPVPTEFAGSAALSSSFEPVRPPGS